LLAIALIVALSILPSVLYMVWFRNSEKYERERWRPLIGIFLWGAFGGVALALILEVILEELLPLDAVDSLVYPGFFIAAVIAPIIEEFAKPLGLRFVRREINEVEDGLIYGAAAGLGFAAIESLGYSLSSGIPVAILRAVISTPVHAGMAALTGYGMALVLVKKRSGWVLMGCYVCAVVIHGISNFFIGWAGSSEKVGIILASIAIELAAVIGLVVFVRKRIKRLDSKRPYLSPAGRLLPRAAGAGGTSRVLLCEQVGCGASGRG